TIKKHPRQRQKKPEASEEQQSKTPWQCKYKEVKQKEQEKKCQTIINQKERDLIDGGKDLEVKLKLEKKIKVNGRKSKKKSHLPLSICKSTLCSFSLSNSNRACSFSPRSSSSLFLYPSLSNTLLSRSFFNRF